MENISTFAGRANFDIGSTPLDHIAYARALAAWQKGLFDQAIQFATQAIQLNSTQAQYFNLLGACYYHRGFVDQAATAYQRAVQLQPDFVDAISNLCLAYCDLGFLDEALAEGQKALTLRPNSAEVNCNLGNVYGKLGRLLEASACYEETLRIDPKNIHALRNLGHVYKEQGRFDIARQHYEAVLQANPRDGHTYEKLAQIRRSTKNDLPQCTALEAVLLDSSLPAEDRVGMHFALGKMYEDIGEYDRSFQHFRKGNTLIRFPFDQQENERFVNRLIDFFSPNFFSTHRGQSLPRRQPVFVIGMFRSGTTLVEQILSSHPDVFGAGELLDIPKLVAYLPRLTGGATPYPECLRTVTQANYMAFAESYLERRKEQGAGSKLVIDKMLTNYLDLGLIAEMFPQAKVIHCRRDPRDVTISCFTTNFSARPPYSTDVGDIVAYYQHYERLMAHWKKTCPLAMLEIQYEDVVQDLRGATERLLKFCELPWDDRCLNFYQTHRHVGTASDWQVRQPLYSSSVGRWKNFERYLEPWLPQLKALAELQKS